MLTLRQLAPTCSRFCPQWGCAKLHSPTEELVLSFALDDASLASNTTFVWSSSNINLATLGLATNKQARHSTGLSTLLCHSLPADQLPQWQMLLSLHIKANCS